MFVKNLLSSVFWEENALEHGNFLHMDAEETPKDLAFYVNLTAALFYNFFPALFYNVNSHQLFNSHPKLLPGMLLTERMFSAGINDWRQKRMTFRSLSETFRKHGSCCSWLHRFELLRQAQEKDGNSGQ